MKSEEKDFPSRAPQAALSSAQPMPDMQRERDTRNIAIDKVGVKDIRYPIVVLDKNKVRQHTVARINMYVDLPHHFKGTHMSRFIEILNQYRGEISIRNMGDILQEMKDAAGGHPAPIWNWNSPTSLKRQRRSPAPAA